MKAAAFACALTVSAPAFAAPQLDILHAFGGPPAGSGATPGGVLALDASGALSGTTAANLSPDDGTAWRLTPSARGTWQFSTIWTFGPSAVGNDPVGGLTLSSNGTLFGTTPFNGVRIPSGCGSVFRLSQTATGWTARPIWHPGTTGQPKACTFYSPVTISGDGALYGVSASGGHYGAIYRLLPPSSPGAPWTPQGLYDFQAGRDGLYPDQPVLVGTDGAVYGTAIGGPGLGAPVWRLAPPATPGGRWSFRVIHLFPQRVCTQIKGPLLQDGSGRLIGVCQQSQLGLPDDAGRIFRLSPPAQGSGPWLAETLYQFRGQADGGTPNTGLAAAPDGTLYGTMLTGTGGIYALTPPGPAGGAWKETVLWRFESKRDGAVPASPLLLGPDGTLYGTNSQSGPSAGGTIFALRP